MALIAVATSACTPQAGLLEVPDDVTTRAQLNAAEQQIGLPLDDFQLSEQESALVAQANYVSIDNCMRESGRQYYLADVPWKLIDPVPDRQYGIWDESISASNGYEPAPDLEAQAAFNALDAQNEEYYLIFEACQGSVEKLPILRLDHSDGLADPDLDIVFDGFVQARQYAESQEQWGTLVDQWRSCLEESGVKPPDDRKSWAPVTPINDKQGEIRIALVDVACKTELQLVQKLADLEGRYQSVYIQENESALRDVAERREQIVSRANEILTSNGKS